MHRRLYALRALLDQLHEARCVAYEMFEEAEQAVEQTGKAEQKAHGEHREAQRRVCVAEAALSAQRDRVEQTQLKINKKTEGILDQQRLLEEICSQLNALETKILRANKAFI